MWRASMGGSGAAGTVAQGVQRCQTTQRMGVPTTSSRYVVSSDNKGPDRSAGICSNLLCPPYPDPFRMRGFWCRLSCPTERETDEEAFHRAADRLRP